jgi:hypothetical protein
MSKLSEIRARDNKGFAFNVEDLMDSRQDRRYLLGLVKEMREGLMVIADDPGYASEVGYRNSRRARALLAKLEE